MTADNRKSEATTESKDKTPVVPADPKVETVVNPVAVKGSEDSAKKGSREDRLAAAIKSEGVDKVEVWKGDDNGLLYARMTKDGVTRLLSISDEEVEDSIKDSAESLYAQTGF
jgi:hypothetical protein